MIPDSAYSILGVMENPYEYDTLKKVFSEHSTIPRYITFKRAVTNYTTNSRPIEIADLDRNGRMEPTQPSGRTQIEQESIPSGRTFADKSVEPENLEIAGVALNDRDPQFRSALADVNGSVQSLILYDSNVFGAQNAVPTAAIDNSGVLSLKSRLAISSLLASVIDRDVISLDVVEDLETSLAMQKGLTSYYFQDRDPDWLNQLEHYQKSFEEAIKKAREYVRTEGDWKILGKIESEYLKNKDARKELLQQYKTGEMVSGLRRLREIRNQFLAIHDLCEEYKEIHRNNILKVQKEGQLQTRYMNAAALIAIQIVIMTGALLAYILFRQVLGPIRRLTMETGPIDHQTPMPDEVRASQQTGTQLDRGCGPDAG